MPSVLIPLAIATDDHQTQNARSLVEAGAAVSVPEAEATPERLTSILAEILADPGRLSAMSAGARLTAIPDAAGRLADLVEATVAKKA
jgi:UDP-N-acetylglucosamine--N-acetylmuramyl-(pentapeptide) pyrophosphoryl-undecaprenol N-acetylglucosamine transferase